MLHRVVREQQRHPARHNVQKHLPPLRTITQIDQEGELLPSSRSFRASSELETTRLLRGVQLHVGHPLLVLLHQLALIALQPVLTYNRFLCARVRKTLGAHPLRDTLERVRRIPSVKGRDCALAFVKLARLLQVFVRVLKRTFLVLF